MMYFPVEQCFIIIIKFVKNIFGVNYYYRSYSFATERTDQKGKNYSNNHEWWLW